MPSAASSQREQTRRKLVKAAIEVVARRGFHAASVDEIARRAGFSVGALYSNFASKDDLFFAVVDDHVVWFQEQLEDAAAKDDPGRAGAEWFSLLSRSSEQFLVFVEFWAYAVRKPKLRQALAERMAAMRRAFTKALERRSDGAPALDPEVVALLVMALGRGLALEKLADPEVVDDARMGELLAALALGGDRG